MQSSDVKKVTKIEDFPITKVLELMKHCMPHIKHDSEVLKWQYFETPRSNANLYYIENDGKIISFFAMVCHQIKVGDQLLIARAAQDVMTHSEFRGMGHLHLLGKIAHEDVLAEGVLGITFPNEKSERSFRRNEWTELCPVPIRQKYLSEATTPCTTKKTEFRISKLDMFSPQSIDNIWWESKFQVGINRNHEYLRWRYGKPRQVYSSFVIGDNQGILIVKVFDSPDGKILHVCEFFLKDDASELATDVLTFVDKLAKKSGCYKITAWLTLGHRYSETFDDFGLELEESNRFIFITGNETILKKVNKACLWHISHGDSDVY